MNVQLNEALIQKIIECIPQNIKPIDYLMEILSISRESAYRRMRGEIAFTFDEIAKLAYKLNFTVDNIIGVQNKELFFFDLKTDHSLNPTKDFLLLFRDYFKCIEQICSEPDAESMASLNRFSLFFLVPYDHLFKFYYYKWIHQTYNTPISLHYAETVMSPEIMDLRRHFHSLVKTFNHCSFIIDRNIFLTLVREIQYYFHRNLISKDEVLVLQRELTELLAYLKLLMNRGSNESGFIFNFYLSLLNIDINTSYSSFKGGSETISQYWMYAASPVLIKNQEICNLNKKWLESMKKISVLITQSNETLQLEFINKQNEYINTITDSLLYYN
jgi:hypothetical protein